MQPDPLWPSIPSYYRFEPRVLTVAKTYTTGAMDGAWELRVIDSFFPDGESFLDRLLKAIISEGTAKKKIADYSHQMV